MYCILSRYKNYSADEAIIITDWSKFYGILLLQKRHITATKPLWEIISLFLLSFICLFFHLLPDAMLKLILTGTSIKYLQLHLSKGWPCFTASKLLTLKEANQFQRNFKCVSVFKTVISLINPSKNNNYGMSSCSQTNKPKPADCKRNGTK